MDENNMENKTPEVSDSSSGTGAEHQAVKRPASAEGVSAQRRRPASGKAAAEAAGKDAVQARKPRDAQGEKAVRRAAQNKNEQQPRAAQADAGQKTRIPQGGEESKTREAEIDIIARKRAPQAGASQTARASQEGKEQRARTSQSGNAQKKRSPQTGNGQKTRSPQNADRQDARSSAKSDTRASASRKKFAKRRLQKQRMQTIGGIVIVFLIVLIGIIIAISSSKTPEADGDKKTSGAPVIQTEESSTEEIMSEDGTEEETAGIVDAQNQPSETEDTNLTDGQTVYATVRVNIRSIPDTTGEILGKLEAGASIVRTADENGWSTVDYNGTTAYISSEFLTAAPQTQPEESSVSSGGTQVTYTREWPKLADGSWDLANITNDDSAVAFGNAIVGFGYSEASRNAETKIPEDWLYYEKNWGMFNVDWIQDPALPQNQNTIYLTMDEGFPNENTPTILQILKEKNVKVTFFITKTFLDGSAAQVQQMLDEGHNVGNHTCSHPNMPTLSLEEQESQIMTLHNMVKEQFGYEMKLFRFPEGSFTSQSLALVDNLGYKTAFWSYTYKDYDKNAQADPSVALQGALDNLHNGAIYLLHADSSTNLAILADFIDGVRARGFEFGEYPLTAN